ncbi:hypothetical protein [Streptomyces vastus]|uniref:Uncharacterized protein n=1 Tax=Streptomyces vastus TaxID=285451 RepID=A0ABN3QCC5_9ACTN
MTTSTAAAPVRTRVRVRWSRGSWPVAALHGFGAAERLARLTGMWRRHAPDAPAIGQW